MDEEAIDRSLLAKLGGTIVVMGTFNLDMIMQRWAEGGPDPSTPVTVIEKGSAPELCMADMASIAQRCKGLDFFVPAVVVICGAASPWKVLGDLS
jgi:siroheme synthase